LQVTAHDPRLTAARQDLADERLRGKVEAERFVSGRQAWVDAPVLDIRRRPDAAAGLDTQFLKGAPLDLFEEQGGWAWLQSRRDGYVGYAELSGLSTRQPAVTHLVSAPRTFIYPGPDLRFPRTGTLSMGSAVEIVGEAETRGTQYMLAADGTAFIATHLRPLDARAGDYVSVAETLLGTPYLWGGASGFGIDCSGLVQLSMRMAGMDVLRDTDQQERSIGSPIDPAHGLRRGDLVFWKGHVAIMTDADAMIHANGHTMLVSREPLAEAIERIGYLYNRPTSFRRP